MRKRGKMVRENEFSSVKSQGISFHTKGGHPDWSFSELFFQSFFFQSFFFLISPEKNSKTSNVNQQSVLNLNIYHHFPKNLDRTITFISVTLKNTQTEPQKYIIFFNLTNNI